MKNDSDSLAHDRLRSFGRSYTKKFGLLASEPYRNGLSLLQSRIVYEIRQKGDALSGELAENLRVDKGYLSRSIGRLAAAGALTMRKDPDDKRKKSLRLTRKGDALFRAIDGISRERTNGLLSGLKPGARSELVAHLAAAEILLGEAPLRKEEIVLRAPQPGDLGWVIGRHGEVYSREFGWNMDFERLVGEIVMSFAAKNDPRKERAWIAEARGMRLGCVFLVRKTGETAQLRILLVDPAARGLGLGSRLVRECIGFARKAGYRRITLWTNSVLRSARKIYQAEGFVLRGEEAHESFGKELTGQNWELDLTGTRSATGKKPAVAPEHRS